RESTERLRSLGYVQGPGRRGSGADPKDKVEVAKRIAAATGPFENAAEAIRAYRSLVALDSENPLLNMRLADALLRAGKAQESLTYFARVVKSDPLTTDPHVGYATALAQLGRLKDARIVLEKALLVDSTNGQVHYNLGEIARIDGRMDDARRAYESAAKDPITSARAQERLAQMR